MGSGCRSIPTTRAAWPCAANPTMKPIFLLLACCALPLLRAEPDCPPAPFVTKVAPTGSMFPFLKGGELLLVERVHIGDLKLDDVIVWRFAAKKLNVLHRVIHIGVAANGERFVVTKGDHNVL